VLQVSQAFALQSSDFTETYWGELSARTAIFLDQRSSAASAVALLLHFPSLQQHFDPDQFLENLVIDGQEAVASRWVATVGKQAQAQLVKLCIQHDRLRSACRLTEEFGLEEAFPNVRALYRSKTLERMVRKGLWSVAAAFVQEDAALQVTLLQAMLAAGEAAMAQEHCTMFGLDPGSVLEVDEDALEAEQLRRQEQFLQLHLPAEAVCFVDTLAGIETMHSVLGSLLRPGPCPRDSACQQAAPPDGGVDAVALDVEWKPSGRDEAPRPASILQLAVAQSIFVVDLLALAADHPEALSAVLQPLFLAPSVFKLGVGVCGDLRKLAASYPSVAAFQKANACLDLATLWRARDGGCSASACACSLLVRRRCGMLILNLRQENFGKVIFFLHWWLPAGAPPARRRGADIGLSRLADAVLGKAIDKAMQVSDWERRPLSPQQLRYAAVDAHAALQILQELGTLCPAYASVEGLRPHCFNWEANPAAQPELDNVPTSYGPPPPGDGPQTGRGGGGGGGGVNDASGGAGRSVLARALPACGEFTGGIPPSGSTTHRSWLANGYRKLRCIPHRALLHGLRC
jgi:hypothetical protein